MHKVGVEESVPLVFVHLFNVIGLPYAVCWKRDETTVGAY
jgi:hypothetical protein